MANIIRTGWGIPEKRAFREITVNNETVYAEIVTLPDVDAATGVLMIIDYAHHEIHSGSSFSYGDVVTLGNGAVQDYLITVPDTAKWPHFIYEVNGIFGVTMELFEATDKAGTTLQAAYNRNRNSIVTPTMTIHKGTSGGTVDGTRIAWRKAGSGTATGKLSGEVRDADERILKQNTKYILRITSAAEANDIAIRFDWYEHTNR